MGCPEEVKRKALERTSEELVLAPDFYMGSRFKGLAKSLFYSSVRGIPAANLNENPV